MLPVILLMIFNRNLSYYESLYRFKNLHYLFIIRIRKICNKSRSRLGSLPRNPDISVGPRFRSGRDFLGRVEIGNEHRDPDLIGIPISLRDCQPYWSVTWLLFNVGFSTRCILKTKHFWHMLHRKKKCLFSPEYQRYVIKKFDPARTGPARTGLARTWR